MDRMVEPTHNTFGKLDAQWCLEQCKYIVNHTGNGGLFVRLYRGNNKGIYQFDENGRLALVPLAITLIASWPLNIYLYDTPFFSAANYLNVVLAALILVALLSRRRSLQRRNCCSG